MQAPAIPYFPAISNAWPKVPLCPSTGLGLSLSYSVSKVISFILEIVIMCIKVIEYLQIWCNFPKIEIKNLVFCLLFYKESLL